MTTTNPIIVYGDVMLDKYYLGAVSRISPEAPVPVVKVNEESINLGGAGNVAHNLATLKGNTVLIGLVGQDNNGKEFSDLCNNSGIKFNGLETGHPTITKIRVIGEHQQITRLDFENPMIITEQMLHSFKNKFNEVPDPGVIIISDYNKGACEFDACQLILNLAHEKDIPVLVDPKGTNWDKYNGAYLLTPNLKEVEQFLNTPIPNHDEAIVEAGKEIINQLNIEYILITRSEKGMTLISDQVIKHFPTTAKEVFDVSGAGDTVIATVAWGLLRKYDIEQAVYLSNIAAGKVVSKLGTAPIYLEELLEELNPVNKKILDLSALLEKIESARNKNQKIVFTNGCFDIMHRGHLDYLKKAKELGDVLIIGVNSDSSIKKIKGEHRPLNNTDDRTELLASLEFVDFVTVFEEDTPYNLLKQLKPNILVKGGDYEENNVIGKEFSDEVKIIPFLKGYSTTNLINRIKNS